MKRWNQVNYTSQEEVESGKLYVTGRDGARYTIRHRKRWSQVSYTPQEEMESGKL